MIVYQVAEFHSLVVSFSLELSGDQLTATLNYHSTAGGMDADIWLRIDGDSRYKHGLGGGSVQLEIDAAVTPGIANSVSYSIDDDFSSSIYQNQFSVVSFDTATVFVGTSADDVVFGSSGDDVFHSGGGTNAFDAGAGNDTFVGAFGENRIYGRLGTDTVDYSEVDFGMLAGMTISLINGGTGGSNKVNDRYASIENVIGTNSNDSVQGSDDANELDGNGGNDVVYGFAGNDILRGGVGIDRLSGGADADVLEGGEGRDELRGDAGDDVIVVLAGDDAAGETYDGGLGTDTLRVAGVSNLADDIIQGLESLDLAAGG